MVRASWFEDERESYGAGASYGRSFSVVKLFLMINIAAFVIDYLLFHFDYGYTTNFLGLNCNLARTVFLPVLAVQLVTYQFLHGDVWHIFFNMLMLWFFGRELEAHMGSRRFTYLYLLGGVAGGVIHIMVALIRGGQDLPVVVGASGAIYGIIVYYAMKWPNRNVIFIVVTLKVKTLAMIFVGISLLYGLFPTHGDMTAHMCHLGGAFFGFLVYRYESRLMGFKTSFKKQKENKERQKSVNVEKEMDKLLSKIHNEGINSLTDAERKFLNSASRKFRNRR